MLPPTMNLNFFAKLSRTAYPKTLASTHLYRWQTRDIQHAGVDCPITSHRHLDFTGYRKAENQRMIYYSFDVIL